MRIDLVILRPSSTFIDRFVESAPLKPARQVHPYGSLTLIYANFTELET